MKTIFASLLASAAIALNLEATSSLSVKTMKSNAEYEAEYVDVEGANNYFIRGDLLDGFINPDECSGDCWFTYLWVMSQPALRGDTDLSAVSITEW